MHENHVLRESAYLWVCSDAVVTKKICRQKKEFLQTNVIAQGVMGNIRVILTKTVKK